MRVAVGGLTIAFLCAGSVLAGPITDKLAATPYWYNGDPDGFSSFLSEVNGQLGSANVYDDFNAGPGGVTISGVFSNDLFTPGSAAISQAEWEIRSGVSSGHGGALIASGTDAAQVIDTGTQANGGSGNEEVFTIEVSGLDVSLDPGTYWLTVAPVFAADDTTSGAYMFTTAGANAIGSPQAQDGNSFESDQFGDNFTATASVFGGGDPADGDSGNNIDLSEGVSATPEPATAALIVGSALFLALRKRRVDTTEQR